MTKAELIKSISERTVVSKTGINEVIKALISEIHANEKISIQGLGTFKHVHKPAHVARNPQTSERINVPAKTVLKFTASK